MITIYTTLISYRCSPLSVPKRRTKKEKEKRNKHVRFDFRNFSFFFRNFFFLFVRRQHVLSHIALRVFAEKRKEEKEEETKKANKLIVS